MPRLLHISDPHFGALQVGALDALLRLSQSLAPDVVVLTGDITQRARESEFIEARAFVDALRCAHVLCVPGNHDLPFHSLAARMLCPYRGYRRHLGDDLEPVIDVPGLVAIGVDTTRRLRVKNGAVSALQTDRVVQLLTRSDPSQLKVVATHHPALVSRAQDWPNRLRGGENAARAWAEAGADIALGGHIHLPYEVDVSALGRQGSMVCVQAGTSVSARTRHGFPNSVNLLAWEIFAEGRPRTCQLDRWEWVENSVDFSLVQQRLLVL